MQIHFNAQAAMSGAATHLLAGKGIQSQQTAKEGSKSEEASEGPAAQAAEAGKGTKINIVA
jgi:hypothetical protein